MAVGTRVRLIHDCSPRMEGDCVQVIDLDAIPSPRCPRCGAVESIALVVADWRKRLAASAGPPSPVPDDSTAEEKAAKLDRANRGGYRG